MKQFNNATIRPAFTLLELIVVISIIGILATIGMVAYTNIQQKSRDSRRKQDLNAIKSALILYYQDHGHYPPDKNLYPASSYASDSQANWIPELSGYMSTMPKDPRQSQVPLLPSLGKIIVADAYAQSAICRQFPTAPGCQTSPSPAATPSTSPSVPPSIAPSPSPSQPPSNSPMSSSTPQPSASPGLPPSENAPECENKNNIYCYQVSAVDRTTFTLWTRLENQKDAEIAGNPNAQCNLSPPASTTFNYCIKSPSL